MFTWINQLETDVQYFKTTYEAMFYMLIAVLIIVFIILFVTVYSKDKAEKTNEEIEKLNKEIELLKAKCDDTNKLIYRLLGDKVEDDIDKLDVTDIIEAVKNK